MPSDTINERSLNLGNGLLPKQTDGENDVKYPTAQAFPRFSFGNFNQVENMGSFSPHKKRIIKLRRGSTINMISASRVMHIAWLEKMHTIFPIVPLTLTRARKYFQTRLNKNAQ